VQSFHLSFKLLKPYCFMSVVAPPEDTVQFVVAAVPSMRFPLITVAVMAIPQFRGLLGVSVKVTFFPELEPDTLPPLPSTDHTPVMLLPLCASVVRNVLPTSFQVPLILIALSLGAVGEPPQAVTRSNAKSRTAFIFIFVSSQIGME
jgi:hypothetical protein